MPPSNSLTLDQQPFAPALCEVAEAAPNRLLLLLPADTPSDLARARRDQLAREWDSVQSRLQIADREIERLDASRAATAAQLARVRQVLPLLGERVRARETLVAQQSMARSTWLELRQELAEREGEAAVLTQQLRQADVDSALARDRRRQILVERAESLRTKLTEVERSLQDTTTDLVRAQQRQARRTLTAPVAGTVADLRVHTIGGVARDGDALLRIVPETSSLEVEAKILNRDVGHIRVGMPVVVKVDSFPFTRYGTLPGRVLDVSADADDAPAPGGPLAAQNAPVYKARIALDRDHLMVDGTAVRLVAGMQVTADIRVGDRRAIDYILGPLLRLGDEALRER